MENEVQENVEVKAVEETPAEALPQNKEAAVLEKAIEVGDVICFLSSAKASYVTGTAVNVDGGTSPVV